MMLLDHAGIKQRTATTFHVRTNQNDNEQALCLLKTASHLTSKRCWPEA